MAEILPILHYLSIKPKKTMTSIISCKADKNSQNRIDIIDNLIDKGRLFQKN